jgi:hypothetical protein
MDLSKSIFKNSSAEGKPSAEREVANIKTRENKRPFTND